MWKYRALAILAFMGLFPLSFGCGGDTSLDRIPLHGTVTAADGERFNGAITFLPVEGQSGPAATALLVDGKYEFDRVDGPTKGPHSVQVRRTTGRSIPGKASAAKQQANSSKTEWTLSAEVADDGQYLLDLTLDK
jgi:hypothetical protein